MPLVTGVVVLIFGGLTLLAAGRHLHQDEADHRQLAVRRRRCWAACSSGQSLLRYVFGDVYKLKPRGLDRSSPGAGACSSSSSRSSTRSCGGLFDTDFWVAFKVWAIMPITVIFAMLQLPVLTKYAPDHKAHGHRR